MFRTAIAAALAALTAVTRRARGRSDAAKPLHALFDSEWERGLVESPENASSNGDDRFNDRWTGHEPRRHRQARGRGSRRTGQAARDRPFRASAADQLNYDTFAWGWRSRSNGKIPRIPATDQPPGRGADRGRHRRDPAVPHGQGLSRLAGAHGRHPDRGRPEHRADGRRRAHRQRPAQGADGTRGADRRAGRRHRSFGQPVLPPVRAFPRHRRR